MPAIKSSPSSSPKPSSTKPNHTVTESETMRRSFSNLKSARVRSQPYASKDLARQSYEDKENRKDLNLKSTRVPSLPCASKGTKNFMAPTISALSKFNTTSPRKKTLVDRNNPPRSSLSSSNSTTQVKDLKYDVGFSRKKTVSSTNANLKKEMDSKPNDIETSHDSTTSDMGHKIEMDFKSNQIEASHDPTISVQSDSVFHSELLSDKSKDTGPLPETVSEQNDCASLDPTFNITTETTCDVLVALKYRDSNPRVQPILNRRREGNPHYSDVSSKDSPENVTSGEVTSKDSQKEPENVSYGDIAGKGEELIVSSKPKGVLSKPKLFFTRLTILVALLLVLLSFTSLSGDPPVPGLSLSKMYVPPEITQFARQKLQGLAQRFHLWSANTLMYIRKLIYSNLTKMHKLHPVSKLPPVQYINLTTLLEEDHLPYGGYRLLGHTDDGAEFRYKEENVLVTPTRRCVETQQFKGSDQDVEDEEEDIKEVIEQDNSPGFEVQVLHQSAVEVQTDLSLSKLYVTPRITQFSNTKLEGLTQRFQMWSENNFVYIRKLISNLTQVHKRPPLRYFNLTALLEEDHLPDGGYPLLGHNNVGAEFRYEENVLVAPTREIYIETEQFEECHQDVKAQEEDIEEVVGEDQTEPESEVITLTNSEAKQAQQVDSSDIHSDIKTLMEQSMVISEVTEIHPEPKVSEVGEPEVQGDVISFAEIGSTKAEDVFQNSELYASMDDNPQNSAHNGSEDNFLSKNAVSISLLVLLLLSSLLAVAAFTYVKRGKASTTDATTLVVDQPMLTKKFNYSPSEMSSFRRCSYDSKQGLKDSSEAQSKGRRTRKNYKSQSLASSDISASYGSFTTYEKISSKHHGYADEDTFFTPVRRSSRINKQVTSS